jgi:hypothetical protein
LSASFVIAKGAEPENAKALPLRTEGLRARLQT